jgi:hypothetical protein
MKHDQICYLRIKINRLGIQSIEQSADRFWELAASGNGLLNTNYQEIIETKYLHVSTYDLPHHIKRINSRRILACM